ncbi:hypothetical protein A2239_03380 [Candidatus Uhrbacteria bacterium RIFOXYA2_FULL_40_9]|nr:MAG: Cell division protein [Candidatus Uhrbacteria bacterium GW2011_GWF2_40_263]OGL91938.1 MAG: hypothetical protein A2239_03380 [Candidatus Uhrbacteria bacterium RIFOXYA2_FULL_40_9]OGL96537.1 MAG: hypothetical protein A2332_00990 [Candidatus Uhrbacteria bacterium RIFOXYB2_FULL_41_18]HBK35064.1 hypothetical protein [Candidatus Uhrbacteria bacterium]HCB55608.1 hypothetical protein [Candidatus Uhrbacteria bacterium]
MILLPYRITKFALQNFWRNFWLSVITISMLVLTLLSINILLVFNFVTDQAVNYVEDRVEISVYFYEQTTEEQLAGAVAYLRSLSQVRDVEVVTAQEALDRFIKQHADDEEIMQSIETVEDNPFGPTLVVKAESVQDFDFIIQALENPNYQDLIREKDFSNYEEIISGIRGSTERVQWFGYGLTAIFLLIAILIVFNTVRIGIFIHREEIAIMKLVGASSWFVRAPFLLEGIIYSVFALLIVVAILYPVLLTLEPKFSSYFGSTIPLMDHFYHEGIWIFVSELIALILINTISTGLAMRKYLKV